MLLEIVTLSFVNVLYFPYAFRWQKKTPFRIPFHIHAFYKGEKWKKEECEEYLLIFREKTDIIHVAMSFPSEYIVHNLIIPYHKY